MPTSASTTFSATRLEQAHSRHGDRIENINLATGTYTAGTVVGEITATSGTFGAYASGHADGTQNASYILQYGCTVDGSGNITINGEWGATEKGCPAYYAGDFLIEDLLALSSNIDANAITVLKGRIVRGTITTNGLIHIP